MPPYGEYNGYAAPAGGGYVPQYPQQAVPAPPAGYAYAAPQYGMMPPQPMPVTAAAPAPPPPQPAPAAATIPVVYHQQQQQQKKKSKAGGLFGGLRNKSAAAPAPVVATAPSKAAAGLANDLLKSTENGMESIYASTPDQIRRAADYNEKESQRLLTSLMSSNRGKKEMQQITSKAYAHANEAKRLQRKAELLDAELRLQKEEREHDEMRQSRNPYAGCGVAPGIGARGDVEMRQQDNHGDGDECNMALCGAFGGIGGGDIGDHNSVLLHDDDDNDVRGHHGSHFDANSIVHHRPASIQVRTSAPSYDIREYKDATPSDDNAGGESSTRGRSKNRGGRVMGFLRGRSKSRDASSKKSIGGGNDDQTNGEYTHSSDAGFSGDGATRRNPEIVHNIHKVEAETTDILDHEDGDNYDNDDDVHSAGYAVAPSSLKVISKVDAVRQPKEQPRKMRPGDVVLDLSAMLIDEERDRAAGRRLPGGETSLSKTVDMKKRGTSFRKTISRLTGKGQSKTAQGFIGTDDSDDEDQNDFGNSQSDKDKIDALEWRNPAQIARGRADDMSLPAMSPRHRSGLGSPSFNGSVASCAVKAQFAPDRRLVNSEEIATAVKNGKLRRTKSKSKPSTLDRQRSRKDRTHDELDAGAIKGSESFDGFVDQRRSDLMGQKKQKELSQMKAFYDTYGEEAYREVYGPYEQQLGYGLFYNEQGGLALDEGPTSMAFGSQSNLGRIPEDKPVRRGRSTVRSATDAPYYPANTSPINSHQPSYSDHNQAQQQQWGDGINEYGTSIPSHTAPAQHHPITVTESRLARQRSSNRNNKQSVDLMLRRMRSECSEDIESRSAAVNQW